MLWWLSGGIEWWYMPGLDVSGREFRLQAAGVEELAVRIPAVVIITASTLAWWWVVRVLFYGGWVVALGPLTEGTEPRFRGIVVV